MVADQHRALLATFSEFEGIRSVVGEFGHQLLFDSYGFAVLRARAEPPVFTSVPGPEQFMQTGSCMVGVGTLFSRLVPLLLRQLSLGGLGGGGREGLLFAGLGFEFGAHRPIALPFRLVFRLQRNNRET